MEQSESSVAAANTRARWGEALDAGFSIVPDVLLRYQSQLGLTPLDVVVLLNINLHWWKASELPFPRLATIGSRIGVSARSIERRVVAMEKRGLMVRLPGERHEGLTIRRFDMSGLIRQLQSLARTDQAYAVRRAKQATKEAPAAAQKGI